MKRAKSGVQTMEMQACGKSPKQDRMPGTQSSTFEGILLVTNFAEVASANLRFRNKEMRQRVVKSAIAAICCNMSTLL